MATTTTAGRILRRDYLKQRKLVRRWTIFFILALVFSGLTAFALEEELSWLLGLWPGFIKGGAHDWVKKVYEALKDVNERYPFLAYGYDWLAFAHLVIAVAFVGVLWNPVRNKWIIEFGMMACVMVFPLALLAGTVRGIPIGWRLIDCSFGVVGLVPLRICYKKIKILEKWQVQNRVL
ncbi:MAG TPA: hypothetical protein VL727_18770 [Puia sp.]|jgi:hypothetical protein|nr:hypothetical protein [Puia sp.]